MSDIFILCVKETHDIKLLSNDNLLYQNKSYTYKISCKACTTRFVSRYILTWRY